MLWPISCGGSSGGHAAELVAKLNYKYRQQQQQQQQAPDKSGTPSPLHPLFAHRCTSCQQVERVVAALTTVNSSNCVYVVCVR